MDFRRACINDDFAEASRLLEKSESLDNELISGWGSLSITPLHWACRLGNLSFTKQLIKEYGVNPEATLCSGHEEMPLHLAAVEGHIDIIKCNPDFRFQHDGTSQCLS